MPQFSHDQLLTSSDIAWWFYQYQRDKIEDELEMTMVCHRPEGLEQLEAQTNFTKRELQVLYRGFKNECPSGVVNEETFKQIYAQFFPHGDASTYAHYLFHAFDTTQTGSVKFEDFVTALSILLRGTVHEKLRWTFNLYDINKDGYINKEEMMDIVKAIYDMMGKYTYPVLREDTPRQHKMDKNKDGIVTLDEFLESCQEDDNIMRSLQLFQNVISFPAKFLQLPHITPCHDQESCQIQSQQLPPAPAAHLPGHVRAPYPDYNA
ncbi:hypothetical protein MC885_020651 [Smutsia gigantea]|nr:hypothetical protein MC885_020651 [Smutsia gigantea]